MNKDKQLVAERRSWACGYISTTLKSQTILVVLQNVNFVPFGKQNLLRIASGPISLFLLAAPVPKICSKSVPALKTYIGFALLGPFTASSKKKSE